MSPKSASMNSGLPKSKVPSHCQDAGQQVDRQIELPLHEIAARRAKVRDERIAEENRICAEWFAAGVKAWGKAFAYAEEIGVDEAVLSDMKAGKRVVQLRHCLPLLRSDPSFDAFVGWQCKVGARQLPAKITPLTKDQVQDRIAYKVRAITQLWQMMRADLAADLGATEEDVDAALASEAAEEAAK